MPIKWSMKCLNISLLEIPHDLDKMFMFIDSGLSSCFVLPQ